MSTLETGLKDVDLLGIALANLNCATISESCVALRSEWSALAATRGMSDGLLFDARRGKRGEPIFIVISSNGYHESYSSFEDAIRLLVDSHRTRAEDREEVYSRLIPVLPNSEEGQAAIRRCRSIVVRRHSNAGIELEEDTREALSMSMAAREVCSNMAKIIVHDNPAVTGEDRDRLLIEAIAILEV